MRAFRLLAISIAIACIWMANLGFAQQTDVTKQDVKQEAASTMEKAKAYAEQQKQEYSKQVQTTLDDLSKKIDQLKEQARNYKGEASTKIEAGMADMKTKQDHAKQKLQEIGSSTGAAWDDMKAGLDKAVTDLQKAYNDASSHFKQK
ncbi:MAG: hypothetical protein ACLQPD_01595 [Desulfomonilaceae bacterium]